MLLLPAIDIKGGYVARQQDGPRLDAIELARGLLAEGARWLHVVDMDRAFATGGNNDAVVNTICGIGEMQVQVSGNLLALDVMRAALAAGAKRVVLGTAVGLDAVRLGRFTAALGAELVALSVDVRGGKCAARGAPAASNFTPDQLVERARDAGIGLVVYRDLTRDGTLAGADLESAARLAGLGVRVIVAGGVSGLRDIEEAKRLGLEGVIVGRALHELRFTLAEALACCS